MKRGKREVCRSQNDYTSSSAANAVVKSTTIELGDHNCLKIDDRGMVIFLSTIQISHDFFTRKSFSFTL